MYKIERKGRTDPLMVNDEVGKMMQERWAAGTLPAKVAMEGLVFLSSDIKAIERVAKSEAERAPSHTDADREYLEFRRKMLGLSVEQRANIMRIPNLIWSAHTTEPMPEETKEAIKARQLAYLTENPNCMYANPKVYQDLIPHFRPDYVNDGMQPIRNSVPTALLRILQNVIHQDLVESAKTTP